MASLAYVKVGPEIKRRCILCEGEVDGDSNENLSVIREQGLVTLKSYAERWSNIDERVCKDHPYKEFRQVCSRLDFSEGDSVRVHKGCRASFSNRLKRKEDQHEKLSHETTNDDVHSASEATPPRRQSRKDTKPKKLCFVCNTGAPAKPYNQGGIGRCSEDSSAAKLKDAMQYWMQNQDSKFYEASQRLQILLIGCDNDTFAADVYYHKQCYNFYLDFPAPKSQDSSIEEVEDRVIEHFLRKIGSKVIKDHDAFLLSELLQDCVDISEEFGLDACPTRLRHTYRIKSTISEHFGEKIEFSNVGKYVAVHSSDVNPLTYTVATLKGHALREDDIAKSFANLIRRKIAEIEDSRESWPPTPEEFLASLDESKPLSCIFNCISWTVNPKRQKDRNGYVKSASSQQAEKIAAISECWERLITKKRTPTSTAMSLTLHRVTGSVEATTLLHHCGMGISYTDVRFLTNHWAKTVSLRHKKMLPAGFLTKRSVHVTFDNSDGKQQTLTGDHTTHHTTGTIFQTRHKGEDIDIRNDVPDGETANKEIDEEPDFGIYKISKKRMCPPSFPEFTDKYSNSSLLDTSLNRDIAWVMVGHLGAKMLQEGRPSVSIEELHAVGSWTAFMKDTGSAETVKCKLEYLPVVPFPPSDNIIKWYMGMIIQLAEDLEIDHVFVHADEAINSKILMIMWLHQGKYEKIIPLIGGFHTLLVYLKILHKKYACLGIQQWWVDAAAIKEGSVCQAIEGRHYYRGIKLHKQSLNALLKCLIDKHIPTDPEMIRAIANLRYNTTGDNLQALLQLDGFDNYCRLLLKSSAGTQSQMMIQYIKDVSGMLALIYAVREKSIELHAVAERAMLPKLFAFNHINYARYLTMQHVNFELLELNNKDAWEDLIKNGFGGSLSGERFSTIHGDLITETTINREVKVRGGPMRGGYSTSLKTNDTFIKTSHLVAKIRRKLKEKMNVLASSVHKEVTPGARRKHDDIVNELSIKVKEYFDPFLDGPARHFKTGCEIDITVIKGIITSDDIGETLFKTFVKERIMAPDEERKSVFDSISKTKIRTGLEKKKKNNKCLDVIKEDRQAFGLLVGKVSTPSDALAYPLTSVPLALAEPDMTLKQQKKSSLRKHLYDEANAITTKPSELTDWFVDGMAAVRCVSSKETWQEYADAVLSYCTPNDFLNMRSLSIIFDSYENQSIKQMTQMKRGNSNIRVYITSINQKMPKGDAWDWFLFNSENKTELIRILVEYYKTINVRKKLHFQLIVTQETKTWEITKETVTELLPSNHVEADTRLILEASKSHLPVVIKATDTDILVIMCYAHAKRDFENDWMMMIDHETFVSVKAVRDHFGDKFCSVLPAYHSITGCDTTSFPANIGKVRPLQKMLKQKSVDLLSEMGISLTSFQNVSSAIKFYHSVMYTGKRNETITDTRVRMYQAQKVKSSVNLISDEDSVKKHVLRADLQTLIWHQCMEQNMTIPDIEGRGWYEKDGQIVPVWFDVPQLPPGLCKSRKKKKCANVEETKAVPDDGINSNTLLKNIMTDEVGTTGPQKKKAKLNTYCDDEHFGDVSSDSSCSTESINSSDWEVWDASDWLSETSDDDPDW